MDATGALEEQESTAPSALAFAERLERNEALDSTAATVSARLPEWIVSGRGREVLSGSWLGHALHPLLTDFPLGCWASASLLDLAGFGRHPDAARRLVGLGILASVPTAASGLSDWSRLGTRDRRVGLVHAQLNSVALSLYVASYLARRRRRNGRGILLAIAGGLVATAGGYLGGHLTTVRAVTRDNQLIDTPVGGAG